MVAPRPTKVPHRAGAEICLEGMLFLTADCMLLGGGQGLLFLLKETASLCPFATGVSVSTAVNIAQL